MWTDVKGTGGRDYFSVLRTFSASKGMLSRVVFDFLLCFLWWPQCGGLVTKTRRCRWPSDGSRDEDSISGSSDEKAAEDLERVTRAEITWNGDLRNSEGMPSCEKLQALIGEGAPESCQGFGDQGSQMSWLQEREQCPPGPYHLRCRLEWAEGRWASKVPLRAVTGAATVCSWLQLFPAVRNQELQWLPHAGTALCSGPGCKPPTGGSAAISLWLLKSRTKGS